MKTITNTEAKQRFDELISSIAQGGEPVIVEQDGLEVVVILRREEFDSLLTEEDRRFWETVDQIQELNDDKDPEEVLADITALVEEVRSARPQS
jgi:prevent-host-death family protein